MLYRITGRLAAAGALMLLFTAAVVGQQNQAPSQAKSPDYVDFSGFKGKVFEVKHRDPRELVPLLSPLGSGFKGAIIAASSEFKTLTVRDFPENIATIEEALKRLDVPAPPRAARPTEPDVELHVHVLIASNVEGAGGQYPAELKDVLKQLQATLSYKNYYLLTSLVQRAKLTNARIQTEGSAAAGPPLFDKLINTQYSLQINQILRESSAPEAPSMLVRDFHFSIKGLTGEDERVLGSARVLTNLSVRDGEKLVVGTASLKDKGMVLVLSAKVIK